MPAKRKRKKAKRKFPPVPKTKGGVPTKYVRGAKNPKAREAEIKRTAKLYKEGKLTPAMMKAISKKRSKGCAVNKQLLISITSQLVYLSLR